MKKEKALDPLRLDVATLARDGAPMDGQWRVEELTRLAQACVTPADDGALEPVRWAAQGEQRSRPPGEAQLWLHLQASGSVWLQCQRCLQPVHTELEVDRSFRFVRSEAEAEAEDLDSEEEVLALPRTLDLRGLVEDELILALPLVPRHEECPEPLPMPSADLPEEAPAPEANPFAKLAVLKRGKPSN